MRWLSHGAGIEVLMFCEVRALIQIFFVEDELKALNIISGAATAR